MAGIVWAGGFLLDGQTTTGSSVPAAGTDAGETALRTRPIFSAFAARGKRVFPIDSPMPKRPESLRPASPRAPDQMKAGRRGGANGERLGHGHRRRRPRLSTELNLSGHQQPGPVCSAPRPAVAASRTLTYTRRIMPTAAIDYPGAERRRWYRQRRRGHFTGANLSIITVTPVNDAPSHQRPDQTVLETPARRPSIRGLPASARTGRTQPGRRSPSTSPATPIPACSARDRRSPDRSFDHTRRPTPAAARRSPTLSE